jgi:hypothetical protein
VVFSLADRTSRGNACKGNRVDAPKIAFNIIRENRRKPEWVRMAEGGKGLEWGRVNGERVGKNAVFLRHLASDPMATTPDFPGLAPHSAPASPGLTRLHPLELHRLRTFTPQTPQRRRQPQPQRPRHQPPSNLARWQQKQCPKHNKKHADNDRIRTKTPRPNKGPASYGKRGGAHSKRIDIKTSKPTPYTASPLFLPHHYLYYNIPTPTTTSLLLILNRHFFYHTITFHTTHISTHPIPFLGILNLICIPKKCLYIPKLFFE